MNSPLSDVDVMSVQHMLSSWTKTSMTGGRPASDIGWASRAIRLALCVSSAFKSSFTQSKSKVRQPESNNQGNCVAKPVGQDETIRLYHQHLQVDVCDVSLRCFLASQDAQEVMRVTYWVTNLLTNLLSVGIDFTDVTLVSDDTYRRLYWCDPDDPGESYLVMKVI